MKTTNLMATASAFLGLLILGSVAEAHGPNTQGPNNRHQSPQHIRQLANRARSHANFVLRQTRQIPGRGALVRQLRRDGVQCLQTANRVRQLANRGAFRRGGNRGFVNRIGNVPLNRGIQRLNRELRGIHANVRRMQDNIIARRTVAGPNPVGHVNQQRRGNRAPNAFARDRLGQRQLAVLRRLDATLHQMQGTVRHLMVDSRGTGARTGNDRPGRGPRQARLP